jgi:hypothetical protein
MGKIERPTSQTCAIEYISLRDCDDAALLQRDRDRGLALHLAGFCLTSPVPVSIENAVAYESASALMEAGAIRAGTSVFGARPLRELHRARMVHAPTIKTEGKM